MQSTSNILMIRPAKFAFNEQTAASNAFQIAEQGNVQQNALAEFDAFVKILRNKGVQVEVSDDIAEPHTPDSIFPNNWVSFHQDGSVFLYPMQAENRRLERREEIIEQLKKQFNITKIHNLSYLEKNNKFLEGTGSVVLDRDNYLAYACLSPRTNLDALNIFCQQSGYKPVPFSAADQNGKAIYHTNVMMCIGEHFAVICLSAIASETERNHVQHSLQLSRKEIIDISFTQMENFAGNMLQLKSVTGASLIVLSKRAYQSLTKNELVQLEQYGELICAPLTTIENNGGGSARCMIAEIHLTAVT